MTTEQLLCETTKRIWNYYLITPSEEHLREISSLCAKDLVIIGTGKSELFVKPDHVMEYLKTSMADAAQICLEVIDEWYECLKVAEDVRLVYGGLWARERSDGRLGALIDMDTRFSMLYRWNGTLWEICHIHHSMPYQEQQPGELYPKTLSQKAREALELAEIYQRKSELDGMTGLYNSEAFKHYAVKLLASCPRAYLYSFDLDYFKTINDTFGHITGDRVLTSFADALKTHFPAGAVIGRIGGDEFSVLEPSDLSRDQVEARLNRLAAGYRDSAAKLLANPEYGRFSVGIAETADGSMPFETLRAASDRALYQAKRARASGLCWA